MQPLIVGNTPAGLLIASAPAGNIQVVIQYRRVRA